MQPKTFPILVGTDFSEGARLALDRGLDGIRRDEHATLHVVSVIDDAGHHLLPAGDRHATLMQTMDHVRELLIMDVNAAMKRDGEKAGIALRAAPIIHVRLGAVADQIAELATEIRAELVIVGKHGRRAHRHYVMGSVAERTVRLAPCPVLVVRPTDFRAMDGLPAIEPACPGCLKERELSNGARWWCAAHAVNREPAHTYSFSGSLTDPPRPLHDVL